MLNWLKQIWNWTLRVAHWVRHPKEYLNENWRWEDYRDFFNVTVFRYLVLWFSVVPVLASLLSGLKPPVTLKLGNNEFTLALVMPFSWQLLWVSSLFFFLAIAVYRLWCPKFILKYHDYGEYQSRGHDQRWIVWEIARLKESGADLGSFTKTLLRKQFGKTSTEEPTPKPLIEQNQTVYRYRIGKDVIEVGSPVLSTQNTPVPDAERGLFWEVFGTFSGSGAYARGFILFFLMVSFAIFLLVLVEHVLQGMDFVGAWSCTRWPSACLLFTRFAHWF